MNREQYKKKLVSLGMSTSNKPKKEQTGKPSKYPQGYFKEKCCRTCGFSFVPKAPSELYCSDDCKNYALINAYLKRNYDLTVEQYLDLAEKQGFVCAICHKPNFAMKDCHSGILVVDHDHKTGKVRGLLCHNCNRALGLFQDDTSYMYRALRYLKSVTTIPKGSTPQANGGGSGGL